MKKITYNKLVRDRIPEIIKDNGGECETKTLNKEEYRAALKKKLIEEAEELKKASNEELIDELADGLELIISIGKEYGINFEEIKRIQESKRSKRGGFEKKIELIWATER